MNICIISPTCYPPIARGLEIHVRNLAQELAKLGHTVHLISSSAGSLDTDGGIREYQIKRFEEEHINAFLFPIGILPTILKINSTNSIDVFHLHGPPYLKLVGEFIHSLFQRPVVYTIHGSYKPSLRTKFLLRCFGREVRIIAVSNDIKKIIQSENSDNRVSVIPTGIHTKKFRRDNVKQDEGKAILFIGALTEDKGVSYLLESMAEVFLKCPHTRLIIAGDGPQRSALQAASQKIDKESRIEFRGRIDHDNIPDLMAKADLLVLPSITTLDSIEGTPTVILEAMAAGLPIIASDVGGISEIIRAGENGMLVEERNVADLANKIIEVLSDPDASTRYRTNNIIASKKFDWSHITENIMNEYKLL